MKVIIIENQKNHHKVRPFDSIDEVYSYLFNVLRKFYDYDTMIKVNNKQTFRDLFAYSDTARFIQPDSHGMSEYFTVTKIK